MRAHQIINKASKQRLEPKYVAEGWKEGVGYTVLAGLLSLGAINRLSDLVNSAVTGEPTQSFLNRNSGINKLNDIKTTTGQGIESIKSVSSGGDKKFEMMLSDGRKVRFTTTDLERAKKIAAARQASEPVEVKEQGVAESLTLGEQFDIIEEMVEQVAAEHGVDPDVIWEDFEAVNDHELFESAAWRRKEGKNKKGGLNAKGVASYRRENPGSKLQTAVTTKPSKLKPGSKAAKRRKSFCARMGGMKGAMKKDGKPTRKALALRKWNC